MDSTEGTGGFAPRQPSEPNWDLIDTCGPPDDEPRREQLVTLEESEVVVPDASAVIDSAQDVRP